MPLPRSVLRGRSSSVASRSVSAAVVAGLVVVALTACGTGSDPAPSASGASPSASPSASASASATPTAEPSAPAEPTTAPVADPTPIGLGCTDLVSLQTMYDFDPNFALRTDYTPDPSSLAGAAVANGGVACSWVQLSNGETIEIAVAQPSTAALSALRSDAGAGAGDGEYTSSARGAGEVQAFFGPFWISAVSSYFGTADDAQPLLDSVKAAIG
ncbi:MAG: hypothetical protein H7146_10145 [Burkholderiaceae bacterium]|nr:hypothetical protein [Microbacteriaceae bacterium]